MFSFRSFRNTDIFTQPWFSNETLHVTQHFKIHSGWFFSVIMLGVRRDQVYKVKKKLLLKGKLKS